MELSSEIKEELYQHYKDQDVVTGNFDVSFKIDSKVSLFLYQKVDNLLYLRFFMLIDQFFQVYRKHLI